MVIFYTPILHWVGLRGLTVWPFVWVNSRMPGFLQERTLDHEFVHWQQQVEWFVLPWFVLYLLALPAGWNPWRWRWEYEAHCAEGLPHDEICDRLRRQYALGWM